MTQSPRNRFFRRAVAIALALNVPIIVAIVVSTQVRNRKPVQPIFDTLPPAASELAYYTLLDQWSQSPVTFSMMNCPSNVDCVKAHQTVREAARTWDDASGLSLVEVTGPADIQILWTAGSPAEGINFDGPGGVLAYAHLPTESLGEPAGNIYFDDAENWVFHEPSSLYEIHLWTIAAHEFGHALGLGHSSNPASIMWQEYYGAETLYLDDIEGIQALYGQPEVQVAEEIPTKPEVAPPAEGTIRGFTNVNLNVRSGPGTDFRVVSVTEVGQALQIDARNADSSWLRSSYQLNGELITGWVFSRYVQVEGDVNALPIAE